MESIRWHTRRASKPPEFLTPANKLMICLISSGVPINELKLHVLRLVGGCSVSLFLKM